MTDGTLEFNTGVNHAGFDKDVDKLKRKGKQATDDMDRGLQGNGKSLISLKNVAKVVGTYIGVNLFKDALTQGVQFNAQIEQYTTSFETMTGSAEKAKEIVETLKTTASKTPFELTGLAETTQLLMNYGFSADGAIEKMTMLGDISQGNSDKMNRIATAYGQMSSAGKVLLEDVKQMIEAGFNPLQEISETTGESMGSLYDRISKGTMSVDEITASMERSTSEGGKYFQSMEKQSETLNGKLSTLGDTVKSKLGEAFQIVNDKLKDILPSVIEFIENIDIEAIANIIKEATPYIVALVSGFVSYRIALFALDAPTKIVTAGLKLLKIAISLTSNKTALIVGAIMAVVAGFLYLWNTSDGFRKFWMGVWNKVKKITKDVVNSIVSFFTKTIPEAFNGFIEFIGGFVESIKTFFVNMWNGIIEFFTQTIPAWIDSVIQFFQKIPYYIGYMVGYVIAQFVQWGLDLWNFATVTIPNFIGEIINWFATLPSRIWEWLVNAYTNIAKWGGDIIAKGIEVVTEFVNGIVEWFVTLPSKIWDAIIGAVKSVGDWGSKMVKKGLEGAQNLVDTIKEKVEELPKTLENVGKWLVEGLWEGIKGAKDWLFGKIGGFCDGVVDGFKDFFGIKSPSHVLRDLVGKFLPQGIAVGFENEMPKSIKDMEASLKVANLTVSKNINDIGYGVGGSMAMPYFSSGNTTTNTTNNQYIEINQPVETSDELARRLRLEQRYSMVG
ncbi:MAG: tape measure protein [Thomasclavelia sp.]|uniref:tape measure protein n=1 Tax=Thomasclavelia sp. TaxID=3025757 RepID=UPI0039A01CF6